MGLTAAFSAALGAASIPANVVAGLHHDHSVAPVTRADDAIACLARLRDNSVRYNSVCENSVAGTNASPTNPPNRVDR